MLNLIVGFVLGAIAIIAAEGFCVIYLWNRFFNKSSSNASQHHPPPPLNNTQESLDFTSNKQGIVWALEPEKVPKILSEDKAPPKKDILEVCPVKKYARIDHHSLILTDSDGSQATINLLGCTVLSVSATNLSSRKWAKKYPIKVESRNSVIYKGSRSCYLYCETSWEKESWCKALRLASYVSKESTAWYTKLGEEFHDYITALKAGYPSFMKSSTGFSCEPIERAIRTDVSSSKVRIFLKKLAKKASKNSLENKAGGMSSPVSEDKKVGESSHSFQDSNATRSTKTTSTEKIANNPSVITDTDSDEKISTDEGTLCWNLLISRLFFDAKRNTDMKSSLQARIQRTLSSMRTPSYIGGVVCTNLDVGTLPPYIHSMRVLPTVMNEVWAMEIDIEYSGGAILDIETRLDVREADFEKGIVNASIDSGSVDEVTSDLLEDFEHFGNQLKLSGKIVDEPEKRDEGDNKFDDIKKSNSWRSPYMSRWKGIVNSVANHVSQVPISLAVKVASVRGTLRLHMKPPPSDQLWFGFTSMPEIDFNLEPTVGDHKFSNARVAILLGNRFKAAIRDTLVLPNCEGVWIPWMLADKDDWIPRKTAPFLWVKQETTTDSIGRDASGSQSTEAKTRIEANKVIQDNHLEDMSEKPKAATTVEQPTREPLEDLGSLSQHGSTASSRCNSLPTDNQDLKTPLLLSNKSYDQVSSRSGSPDHYTWSSRSVSVREAEVPPIGEDGNPKSRIGRRARMMDLGKKMGEKLEEKRRNIEEKSRNIVEKMRGPP